MPLPASSCAGACARFIAYYASARDGAEIRHEPKPDPAHSWTKWEEDTARPIVDTSADLTAAMGRLANEWVNTDYLAEHGERGLLFLLRAEYDVAPGLKPQLGSVAARVLADPMRFVR